MFAREQRNCESLAILVAALSCLSPICAHAQPSSADDFAVQCSAFASADFSHLLDAPTQITAAHAVEPSGDQPGYCQVTGYVAPQVGFLLRLPAKSWNGNFLQLGCGGFCGSTTNIAAGTGDFSMCMDSVSRGYACIVSDAGHTGGGVLWAYDNLSAELDFAYRAAHVTALAGKAMVERYYRQAPRKSYFWGCSTGGRQALMEAQRFAWDFDGIIAGDPSPSDAQMAMEKLWAARALSDAGGKLVLEDADLELLHQAVVAKCDSNDGIKDGLIGDPRACAFDPSTLLCAAGQRDGCLTTQQIAAVQKIYTGPVTSQGTPIYTPVALKGSERIWRATFALGRSSADMILPYLGFDPDPGAGWQSANFDFDRDYRRLGIAIALHSPTNPDLRQFKSAGGKLMAYQGWASYVTLPIVDYYETVERTMGGRAPTQEFFRLFVIPGMNHCSGGEGAFAVDWLSYLEAWVEQGRAPDRLLSSHVRVDSSAPLNVNGPHPARLKFPLDPATIEFSRPVYPYPTQVKYRRADPNDAASFGPK